MHDASYDRDIARQRAKEELIMPVIDPKSVGAFSLTYRIMFRIRAWFAALNQRGGGYG